MGLPILFLIVFDFFFWVYRLVWPVPTDVNASSSHARRRKSEMSTTAAATPNIHHQHPITTS